MAVVIETPTYYHAELLCRGEAATRVHGQACRGRCAGLQELLAREEGAGEKLNYWVDFQTRVARRL